MSKTHTRKTVCRGPEGLPCGSTWYERSWSWADGAEGAPIWRCTCCGEETPRAERRRDTSKVTATQRKVAAQIKRMGEEQGSGSVWLDWAEELTDYGLLIVSGTLVKPGSTEAGLGDPSFQLFIGPRGAVRGNRWESFGGGATIKTARDLYAVRRY